MGFFIFIWHNICLSFIQYTICTVLLSMFFLIVPVMLLYIYWITLLVLHSSKLCINIWNNNLSIRFQSLLQTCNIVPLCLIRWWWDKYFFIIALYVFHCYFPAARMLFEHAERHAAVSDSRTDSSFWHNQVWESTLGI